MVRPQVGVALMMILHELATNALKYGSLSVPAGRLAVTWHQTGEGAAWRFDVLWIEFGGPPVKAPSRQGVGTRLLERSTTHEPGGEARLDYLDAGVRRESIFPWAGSRTPQ